MRVATLLFVALPRTLVAQQFPEPGPTGTSAVELVAANALAGGLTAGIRALLDGKNASRAFTRGALGGAVHSSGKVVGTGRHFASGGAGLVLSSLGAAMVSNAGADAPLFDELFLPIGMLRLRWRPSVSRIPQVSVSVYESVVFTELMMRDGLALDVGHTIRAGSFVFVTRNREILDDGRLVQGLVNGSAVVLSEFAVNPLETIHHELVHVKQHSFVAEAWGRPAELRLRDRLAGAKRIPTWIEFDILGQWMIAAERRAFGSRSVFRRLMEHEAETIARR